MTNVVKMEPSFSFEMPEWAFSGVVIVDESKVNINDLLDVRPGSIVRVKDINAIRVLPGFLLDCAFIAGYISENP